MPAALSVMQAVYIKRSIKRKKRYIRFPLMMHLTKTASVHSAQCIRKLENNAVEYTMGPSYMEDDIRAETDKMGFCRKHLKKIYAVENRLGFALVMKTHMDKVINEIEKRNEQPVKTKTLFKKAETPSASDYIKMNWNSPALCVIVYKIHLSGMWIRFCIYISPMRYLKRNTCTARAFVQRITAC